MSELSKDKIRVVCYSCSAIVGLMFAFMYMCWADYIGNKEMAKAKINYQISSQARTEISTKIDGILNECQDGYWLSWLTVDNDIYSFEQVKGYNPNSTNPDHIQSVKELNPFYLKSHSIDKKSKEKLASMDTGFPAFFIDSNDLKNYPSVYEALGAANNNLNSIGFAVTKSSENDVVYVFIITSSNPKLKKCSQKDIHNSLKDLSIYAKRGL